MKFHSRISDLTTLVREAALHFFVTNFSVDHFGIYDRLDGTGNGNDRSDIPMYQYVDVDVGEER